MKIIRGLLMKIDVIKKRGDAQARKVRASHTSIALRPPILTILKKRASRNHLIKPSR